VKHGGARFGPSFALLLLLTTPVSAAGPDPSVPFRQANDAARAGDYPKAMAGYRALAARGIESASLYWNWAQVAHARGETGAALWALLRGREVEPGDTATAREIERVREAANLDLAEIAPSPLGDLRRLGRRLHLDVVALLLLAASVVLHALSRRARSPRRRGGVAVASLTAGLLVAAVPLAGALAAPTAVVLRRGAPLLDAASPTAATIGALREGEAVVVLEETADYLRVEDSAGARGWASAADAWRLDRAPQGLSEAPAQN
jgi:Bacterial SH3 domain